MNRLFRLLPLASLVLTACAINAPKGPGKSPDSPQWRQHQQDVRNLNQFQTRGALLIFLMSKSLCPLLLAANRPDRYRLLLTNPSAAPSCR